MSTKFSFTKYVKTLKKLLRLELGLDRTIFVDGLWHNLLAWPDMKYFGPC
jgi:hypothetical protein